MDVKKPDRSTLKAYFVKNAIPTEANFADLIDATVNQKEDGLVKLAGEPLSLQADGDDAGQKKAINFYKNFADAKPAWTLSLNPRADPANAATSRPGWSVGNPDGASRLFIDETTGRLGVGTVTPGEALEVNGRAKVGCLTIGPWPANADYAFVGASTLNHAAAGNYALLQGNSDGPGRTYVNSPVDVRFRIGNVDKMILANNGNFGVGSDPATKLDVGGVARVGTTFNTWKDPDSAMSYGGSLVIKSNAPQLDFLDTDNNDWSIHVNANKMYFIRQPWNYTDLVLDGAGNVGIGTDNPSNKLQIAGNLHMDGHSVFFRTGPLDQQDVIKWNSATDRLDVGGWNGVAIGHTAGTPNAVQPVLTVDRTSVRATFFAGNLASTDGRYFLAMQNDRNIVGYTVGGGAFWATSTNVSDIALKKDVRQLDNAMAKLRSLRGISFSWNTEDLGDGGQIGVVAQEVEKVYPELVTTIGGRKLVNYQGLIPVLIEALKEQQTRIGELDAEIQVLKRNG